MDPDFYKDKISLFVALAPSVFFKFSTEPAYKQLADQKWLQNVIFTLSYLEATNARDNESDLIAFIKINYPMICWTNPEVCELGKMTPKTIDASPSVDISRSNK